MEQTHNFAVTSSEFLWESPILGLRRDRVVMPGGTEADREIIEHFGAVAIVAVNDRDEIALVRQYRHAVGKRLTEIPAGLLDIAGEDPLKAAHRELLEETGLKADRWSLLLDVVNSPGYSDEVCRVYLAQDLSDVGKPEGEDDEESEMSTTWVSLSEARAMVLKGEVSNSIAVSGILAAAEVLHHGGHARSVDEPFSLRPSSLPSRRTAAGVRPDMKRL